MMKGWPAAAAAALALCASACNFGGFRPYKPMSKPGPTHGHSIDLRVYNAPRQLAIYSLREHAGKYNVTPGQYIKRALAAELGAAGFQNGPESRAIGIHVRVNQFDLGYKKRWWTMVVGFGWSRVDTAAIADLTVDVRFPDGRTYRRRFVSTNFDDFRMLWIGLLAVVPVPVSGFYDEEEQIATVTRDVGVQLVTALRELLARSGGA